MMPPVLQTEVSSSGVPSKVSLGWFTDWLLWPSILLHLSHFSLSWVSSTSLSFSSWLCDPNPLYLTHLGARAPQFGQAALDSPSLRAPRGERSDPVSVDGILKEPCDLLTVLLHDKQDGYSTKYRLKIWLYALRTFLNMQTNRKTSYLPQLWRRSEQAHWQGLWKCRLKVSHIKYFSYFIFWIVNKSNRTDASNKYLKCKLKDRFFCVIFRGIITKKLLKNGAYVTLTAFSHNQMWSS